MRAPYDGAQVLEVVFADHRKLHQLSQPKPCGVKLVSTNHTKRKEGNGNVSRKTEKWKEPLGEEQVTAKQLRIEWIPPGATGRIQLLDVFFNRQWKQFFKIMSDKIRRRHSEFSLPFERISLALSVLLIANSLLHCSLILFAMRSLLRL
uniref:Uncharacterized protein n=1 Tax=Ditylenchus dipsaci TaxID=166011 RepID=A0A915CPV5_9BILA